MTLQANCLPRISTRYEHNLKKIFLNNEQSLLEMVIYVLQEQVTASNTEIAAIASRITIEVERICQKSSRIQDSGSKDSWKLGLIRHRLAKYLHYYHLGSRQGRIELHSHLSTIVYRHITLPKSQLTFSARHHLIEDFLQDFYIEALKAFRRENDLTATYSPQTLLQLAEYMLFCECYAKRRIDLHNGFSQQLIILRAQNYSKRQPTEENVDLEQVFTQQKDDHSEQGKISQQIRDKLIAENTDPIDNVLRDRVIKELIHYLQLQKQQECVDYLLLKIEDLSATEIDHILQLSPRKRDYLQQRFKYHVEKFSKVAKWELVHQWLGADIEHKLGLNSQQWQQFYQQLSPEQTQLLRLKQKKVSDLEIRRSLNLTEKKLQLKWSQVLTIAGQIRN